MSNGTSTETAAASDCAPAPALPPALPAPKPSQHNRLIDLWHAMSEDDQAFWREMFASNKNPDDIREELRKRLDVLFLYNDQLEIFKRWEKAYQARAEEAARQRLDQRLGLTPFSLANPAAAREAFLARAYARAIATGDFDLGFKTLRLDLSVDGAALNREKFALKAAETAAKSAAKSRPQRKPAKSAQADQPDSAGKLSAVEQIQELRRDLFGSIPEDNPQTTLSPPAPAQPPPPPNLSANSAPMPEPGPVAAAPTPVPIPAPPPPAPPVETPAAMQSWLTRINSGIETVASIQRKWQLVEDCWPDIRLHRTAAANFQYCRNVTSLLQEDATVLHEQLQPMAAVANRPGMPTWQAILAAVRQMLATLGAITDHYPRVIFKNGIPLARKDVSDAKTVILSGLKQVRQAALEIRDLLAQRQAALSPANTS